MKTIHPARAILLAVAASTFALAGCGSPKTDDSAATKDSIPALQWVPVATTSDGGAIQYDPAQTRRDVTGKLTDVVIRVRHPYLEGWAQDLPKDYAGETVFQTEQATLRFDCAAHAMGIVRREALGADDGVLDKRVTPEPVALEPVRAGGVGEAVFPKICAPVTP